MTDAMPKQQPDEVRFDPVSVSELLVSAGKDKASADALLEAVYSELRRMAQAKISQLAPGQTLCATDLVHETYLRVMAADQAPAHWVSRSYFFAAAAEAMRRILVERARRRGAIKRGGDRKIVALRESAVTADDDGESEMLALNEALDKLQQEDWKKAALVKLRYFTGLTIPEAADALGISHATAERWWNYSRARLLKWIQGGRQEL
jgi:RNA polymerase sigma factor (TIGR02999 family)